MTRASKPNCASRSGKRSGESGGVVTNTNPQAADEQPTKDSQADEVVGDLSIRIAQRFQLQARIHRLALQREDAEDSLMRAPERLARDKALQALDAERELPQRQGAFRAQPALLKPRQMLRLGVVRAVDDTQIVLGNMDITAMRPIRQGDPDGVNYNTPYPIAEGVWDYFAQNIEGAVDVRVQAAPIARAIEATLDSSACVGIMFAHKLQIKKATLGGVPLLSHENVDTNQFRLVLKHLDKAGMRHKH
jgi:hypothetical protein